MTTIVKKMVVRVKKSGGDFLNIKYFLANKILTINFLLCKLFIFKKQTC